MYDSGKIIIGIIIFLGLFTAPIWYNAATGEGSYSPKVVVPEDISSEECVRSTDYMKLMHMDLLNDWRDEVVRQDNRFIVLPAGEKFEMSLTNTCMNCHSNKTEFCDQCHDYLGVAPYCWDCHVEPQITEGGNG